MTINAHTTSPYHPTRKGIPIKRLTVFISLLTTVAAADDGTSIAVSDARKDAQGFLVHHVASPYQAGETLIRVLLPDKPAGSERLRVVYILPVEAGVGTRWGDGLVEAKKTKIHDRHGVICVAPTFSRVPWFADHPTKKEIRQESHLLKVVLPFVEKTYAARKSADGRLLLGFSKSGWGAFTLLLRNPGTFGRAVAWDAPLLMTAPGAYSSGPIFGTKESFAKYEVLGLLGRQTKKLRGSKRLVLIGYDNFRKHHQALHARMDELEIPHVYRDGPKRKHHWASGWVAEAAELLVRKPTKQPPPPAVPVPGHGSD